MRLYKDGMDYKERKRNRSNLRVEPGEEECTFQPSTSIFSHKQSCLDKSTSRANDTSQSRRSANTFYSDMMKFKQKKEERLRALRKKKEEVEE